MLEKNKIFKAALKEITESFPNVKGVYVFGSFAKGEETQESDLDLAILLDKPADKVKLWDVAQNIAIQIQRDVDLIDLLSTSTVFQFQIITTAKNIYSQDFKACDAFEDLTYAMYIRFNESRQEILDDIKKSGKIY
jgi:predicted nucleotidyltransferase